MSTRQIRRMMAEMEKNRNKNKEEEEPEEFEPLYVHRSSAYEGLEVNDSGANSDSPSENGNQKDEDPVVIPEEDKYGAKKKIFSNTSTKKKNKKKEKIKSKKPFEMDEVEWSITEVNRLLGAPPEVPVEISTSAKAAQKKSIFSINPTHIDVNNELDRVFGPDPENKVRKPRYNIRRMRHEIGLSQDINRIRMRGLSMTQYKTEDGIKYFKFVHSADYTLRCRTLVHYMKKFVHSPVLVENNLFPEDCVEALLENCDYLYYLEEHKSANKFIQHTIHVMQDVAEHTFNFVDGKSRLLYAFVENRPLHIAILKYLHVLTNTGSHRTALELAKVLLNLDPSDPLSVIFILDTLAIRANEFQWLIDLYEFWKEKRQADRLFHMKYSMSLALFHLYHKTKDEQYLAESKASLTEAIKKFPLVASKIIENTTSRVPDKIKNHDILKIPAGVTLAEDLQELMILYALLIEPEWRESKVMPWSFFVDTATELAEAYDSDENLRLDIKNNASIYAQLFRRYPIELKRHLYAIAPMAQYISEGLMPRVKPTLTFNPYPCDGPFIDTYNYFDNWMAPTRVVRNRNNTILDLVQSLNPGYNNQVE